MKYVLSISTFIGALCLASCAAVPPHYHTLSPPPWPDGRMASSAPFALDLQPVGVPEQLDKRQIVLRQGQTGLQVLEGERWGSALSEEIRTALSLQLADQLGSQDAAGLPLGDARPVWRVKVQVRSFDAWLGDRVTLDSNWTIVSTAEPAARRVCQSRFQESAPGGYDGMVAAQQRLIARLAADIATAAKLPGSACKA